MAGLDPTDLEQAFRLHAEGLSGSGADGLTLLAVDGKSLRGSFATLKDKKATQILSVFATDGRIILALCSGRGRWNLRDQPAPAADRSGRRNDEFPSGKDLIPDQRVP